MKLNGSLSFDTSVIIWSVPEFVNLLLIVLINEEKDSLLVSMSCRDDGKLMMKLSIEPSGMFGSNFIGLPQKTDAFSGSSSVNFDFAYEISF